MKIEEFAISEDNFLSKHIQTKNVVVTIFSDENKVQDVHIEFHGDHSLWESITSNKLFSYSEAICGPIMGGSFRKHKDYIFTIKLREEQVTVLSILAEAPSRALHTLLQSTHNPAFSNLESYLLLSVMQQVTPKTQWGMNTSFYKGLP